MGGVPIYQTGRRCCLLPTKPGLCATMESFLSRLHWRGEMKKPGEEVAPILADMEIWFSFSEADS